MSLFGPKLQQQLDLSLFPLPSRERTVDPQVVVTPYDVSFLLKVPAIRLTLEDSFQFLPAASREDPSAPGMAAIFIETMQRYQGRFVSLQELFSDASRIVGLAIVAEDLVVAPPADLIRAVGERYGLAVFLRGAEELVQRQLAGPVSVTLAPDAAFVTIAPTDLIANSLELRLVDSLAESVVRRSRFLKRPSVQPSLLAAQLTEALNNLRSVREYLEETSRGLFRGYERSYEAYRDHR